MKKQRILIHTAGFWPGINYGGVTTSRYNMCIALANIYDIYVVARNHDYLSKEKYKDISNGWNDVNNIGKVYYVPDDELNVNFMEAIIKTVKPDLVYCAGTITSYFRYSKYAIKAANNLNVAVMTTPDGDVKWEALKRKIIKKMLAISYCNLFRIYKNVFFQVTTEEEAKNLNHLLFIPKKRIKLVPNLPYFTLPRENHIKQVNRLKIVYCSRIHPIKNLDVAIEAVLNMKYPVSFDIYGQIEDSDYFEKCMQKIVNLPDHIQIQYKGILRSDEARNISKYYDCFILPTRSENYCYAIEEALSQGCPCIISKNTTPWDDIDGVAGFTIPLNQVSLFTSALETIARMDQNEYNVLMDRTIEYIDNRLNRSKLVSDYCKMFDWCIKNS